MLSNRSHFCPWSRKLYVVLSIILCLLASSLVAFFLFPRSVVVVDDGIRSVIIHFDQSQMKVRMNMTVGYLPHWQHSTTYTQTEVISSPWKFDLCTKRQNNPGYSFLPFFDNLWSYLIWGSHCIFQVEIVRITKMCSDAFLLPYMTDDLILLTSGLLALWFWEIIKSIFHHILTDTSIS